MCSHTELGNIFKWPAQGSQICRKINNMFLIQNKYLSCNCSNPKHLLILYIKRSRSVWQKLCKLKALSSLSVCLSVCLSLCLYLSPPPPPPPHTPQSLILGCEVGCQNVSALTATRAGWVTPNEVSGSSLLVSFSGHITDFPHLICIRGTDQILQLSTMSWKTRQKNSVFFLLIVVMIVLNYHWWELPQVSFLLQHKFCFHVCHDKHVFVATQVCLLRQNFCCGKHIFVVKSCGNKTCHNKLTFVATKMCLSWQNTAFVMTDTCLSRQIFVATKVLLWPKYFATKVLSQQAYFCHDKRCVLSQQTCACCDKHVFVVTKLLL